jgi:hypothetical protein
MEIDENLNNERLQRAIRCLQLIQRTNPPKSPITKAAAKALVPLMDEAANRPLPTSRGKRYVAANPPPFMGVDDNRRDLLPVMPGTLEETGT